MNWNAESLPKRNYKMFVVLPEHCIVSGRTEEKFTKIGLKERWRCDAKSFRCDVWKMEGNFCFWNAQRDCGCICISRVCVGCVKCPRYRRNDFIVMINIPVLCGLALIIRHNVIKIRDDVCGVIFSMGWTCKPVIRNESLWEH
eukprot:7412990-Ditylum_brightwellii.AAC.1